MSDYLPDMVAAVDEETPTPSPDNITAEITDTVRDEDVKGDEGDEEIIKEEEEVVEEEEEKEEEVVEEEDEKVPLVKTRRKLEQDEVFTTPKVKPVAPLEEKKEEPKKKGKRKCSEKQLAHLAKIRQKGLEAARAKNAKNAKDPNFVPKKKMTKKAVAAAAVSEEDIERISTNAIEKYEVKRKERKAIKKKAQEEEEHKAKVKQTINRAMKHPDADDIWAAALGGMMN